MPKSTDISSIIITALSLCSCASGTNRDALEISRIEAKCGVKSGTLRLDKKVSFVFSPDPNEKYENVDCTLSELRTSPLWRHMKYGFVGNEGPSQAEQQ